MKSFKTLLAAAALAALSVLAFTGCSTTSSDVSENSIFSMESQPIYQLPHDHRFHRGDTYIHNDYQEWQYFTVLGRDKITGDEVSIFICPFHQGWVESHEGRSNLFHYAFTNLATEEFHGAFTIFEGEYTGVAGDPYKEDFFFEYHISGNTGEMNIHYDYATETWRYFGSSDIVNDYNTAYDFDISWTVEAPGYTPGAYHGLENIGWDAKGAGYRHNPETMAGLSRYIQVPRGVIVNGSFTVDGREYDIEGDVWYEHQWGNFRNVQAGNYFWGYMRMEDGTAFTWRQYYIGEGWDTYDTGMTRFQVIRPDNSVEYAFGPSFTYTPTEIWTSPKSGKTYPWNGVMESPLGTFYFDTPLKEQETMSAVGEAYIEGYGQIRTGGPDGPIVGKGFVEMVDMDPEVYPFQDLPEEEIFMDFSKINR